MKHHPLLLPTVLGLVALAGPGAAADPVPPLQLAGAYQRQEVPARYWVSEKLDGVRAYWDGHALISRQGNRFNAPDWFTAGFPGQPLDGELWMGRGRFDELSGAVRRYRPDEQEWRRIRFMVFDLPASELQFDGRLLTLQALLNTRTWPHIALIEQRKVADEATLMAWLAEVETGGGEGLMLHRGDAYYRARRTDALLKLKRHQDAEAVVVAHLPGKGKYSRLLGALLVETPDGRRFRIGTGLTDRQRRSPPAIGSTISYRYRGETRKGIPRFASFLRVRDEEPAKE
ncbi:DNA ligase [Zobellella maritima]|uniref:DNA ligase n=1 Tax=Zobellella maritima TaxID=2059725 RepID=UPI000E305CE2|nr:DNA ligase [Zobellella maritima]